MVASSSGNNAATFSPFAEKVITPQPSVGSPAENQFFDFDLSSFSLDAGGLAASSGSAAAGIPSPLVPALDRSEAETSTHPKAMQAHANHPYESVQGSQEDLQRMMSMEMDAMQANQLQQQLEQIHMQSPALFAAFSSNSSHGSTATTSSSIADRVQQILTPALMAQQYAAAQGAQPMFYGRDQSATNGQNTHSKPNMLTPAQSSEMYPHMHPGDVSPMPFGSQHLSNSGEISFNERGELVFTPLLSPTSTQPVSQFTSPHFEDLHQAGVGASSGQHMDPAAQLQAIQATQITLQRQLDELSRAQALQTRTYHHQQTRSSPPNIQAGPRSHVPPNFQPGGQYYEPAGFVSPRQGARTAESSAQATPNAEYFSPLGSPALVPINGQQQRPGHRGPGGAVRHARMSEGLQQTISPALLPQVDGPNGVPALQDSLNGESSRQEWANFLGQSADAVSTPPMADGSEPRSLLNSPSTAMSGNHPLASSSTPQGNNGRSPGLGPHRSNTGKTRPSPMIKPTHRPNRASMNGKGHMSVPASPLVAAFTSVPDPQLQQATRSAFLESTVSASGSTGSGSLSPVDLSAILMPPPPVPGQPSGQSVAPMTPAALMQMAGGPQAGPSGKDAVRSANNSQSSSPIVPRGRKASVSKTAGRPTEFKPRAVRPKPATASEAINGQSNNPIVTLQSLENLRKSLADINKVDKQRVNRPGSSTGTNTPRPEVRPNGKATAQVAKTNKKELDDNVPPEVRRSSHKAAEQKRRDSLKAGFDELRLLLPPINTEALDPESGEPIPGSSAPRLLPKSSLVPDDNPNKGVSKVALLKYSNEYIGRLHAKVTRRDNYIDLLKDAIVAIRSQTGLGLDEPVEELLGYRFEDEDEDEVPTGMLTSAASMQDLNGADSGSGDGETEDPDATPIAESSEAGKQQQRKAIKPKPTGSNATNSVRRKASMTSSTNGPSAASSRRASKSKPAPGEGLSMNDVEMV